jgi:hypothetical protein
VVAGELGVVPSHGGEPVLRPPAGGISRVHRDHGQAGVVCHINLCRLAMWLDVALPAALVAGRRRAWLDIAARLLPVLLPIDSPCPAKLWAYGQMQAPANSLSRCPAAELRRTGSLAHARRRGTGCSLRPGLRLNIEVFVIGPDRHDEVAQEALEPPRPNGCGATRTTSSPLTKASGT